MRVDGRATDELRPLKITRNIVSHAEGSALIEVGGTRIICTASIEDKVPHFLKDTGRGWITAEYAMLPRATHTRSVRESTMGRVGGRTHEIQRLIGRSLRSVVEMTALGERTVWIDCDVMQADGGTRTAAITGGFICLADALRHAFECGMMEKVPIVDCVAAVSVGIVDGRPMLDLCYREDFEAEVDMNVVMTGSGGFVEVQGTAETRAFPRATLEELLNLAEGGIAKLVEAQRLELPGVC
ncbi:MAG: ribonuclease PH [Nitrospirota bacterium]|jgi:ribonuclease PH